jgi:hypothetical protein
MRQTAEGVPELRLNPDDDESFRRIVGTWQAAMWRPAALQMYLRDRYPSAVVQPRDLQGEEHATWYVYRDGHWVNTARSEDRRAIREGRATRRRRRPVAQGPRDVPPAEDGA